MEHICHSGNSIYMPSSRRHQTNSDLPKVAIVTPLNSVPSDACTMPCLQPEISCRSANYYSSAKVCSSLPLSTSQVETKSSDTQLSEMCGIRVPSVFSAARNALYTRYTPRNWFDSYNRLLQANDLAQKNSECFVYDSKRLEEELADQAKANQENSTRKLGDRICDIAFWQSELDAEIGKMKQEIDDLNRARRIVEKFLAETENYLHITQECLYAREKRQGTDLVHDDVEVKLLREVDTVRTVQCGLQTLINDARVQEELNRAALHELEYDKANKFMALQIDESAHSMHNGSAYVSLYDGVECIDQTQSVPETWNKHVSDILKRSQSERTASRKLRERIVTELAHAGKTLSDMWEAVNAALSQRIRELTDARNQIQASLGKTLQSIADTEKEIEDLKAAIKDKEEYLKTASSRLNERLKRPGLENCRDSVMNQLICEVKLIKESIEELKNQLLRAETVLQELLYLRTAKEGELVCKQNSLFIDREKCLALRTQWPGGPMSGAANANLCPNRPISSFGLFMVEAKESEATKVEKAEKAAKKPAKTEKAGDAKKPRKPEVLRRKAVIRARKIKTEEKKKVIRRLNFLRLKKICIKRAQKHLVEYKRAAKREINLARNAKRAGNFYVPEEPRLAFVVRIRGINGIAPKPRKTLQLMRLLQINNGVFVKLNKATLNMLRLIDPYISWGYPSLKTIRRLIYKRGFCKVRGRRLPLTNERIRHKLGRHGILCVEDLVHEIYTVGPNFKAASSFLWRFKLNNPTGGFRKKGRHFVEGGDFGNRENYINKMLKTMV
ncbi:hypothetical protein ACTXT7_008401 [Hymenolepis weldensis]